MNRIPTEDRIRITLDLDREQLLCLMSVLEIDMSSEVIGVDGAPRRLETLRRAVEEAGALNVDNEEVAFRILKLAPVYRELLRHGESDDEINQLRIAESDEELADAEQEALAALAS